MAAGSHTRGARTIGDRGHFTNESETPVSDFIPYQLFDPVHVALFLLFDVEVVFMWPWAQVFHDAAVNGATIPLENGGVAGKGFLLVGMGIFFALLVFGLLYEWKKGAFRWD